MANAAASNSNQLGTAKNARAIDRRLTNAAASLQKALDELHAVVELMETGENQPEYVTPNIEDLIGATKVAKRGVLRANMPWLGFAEGRR